MLSTVNNKQHMRNKQLMQNRIQTLNGLLKKLDMAIHRGGSKDEINQYQKDIVTLVQDISDITERE